MADQIKLFSISLPIRDSWDGSFSLFLTHSYLFSVAMISIIEETFRVLLRSRHGENVKRERVGWNGKRGRGSKWKVVSFVLLNHCHYYIGTDFITPSILAFDFLGDLGCPILWYFSYLDQYRVWWNQPCNPISCMVQDGWSSCNILISQRTSISNWIPSTFYTDGKMFIGIEFVTKIQSLHSKREKMSKLIRLIASSFWFLGKTFYSIMFSVEFYLSISLNYKWCKHSVRALRQSWIDQNWICSTHQPNSVRMIKIFFRTFLSY